MGGQAEARGARLLSCKVDIDGDCGQEQNRGQQDAQLALERCNTKTRSGETRYRFLDSY